MSDERSQLPELDRVPRLVTETQDNPVVRTTDLERALYPVRRWLWLATGIGVLNVYPNAERTAESLTAPQSAFDLQLQIFQALIALI